MDITEYLLCVKAHFTPLFQQAEIIYIDKNLVIQIKSVGYHVILKEI